MATAFSNRVRPRRSLGVAALLTVAYLFSVAAAAGDDVDFADQIESILSGRCLKCHGPKKRRGELLLTSRLDALEGGESGEPAFVPGSASESLLIEKVTSTDPDDRMPSKGDPLSDEEIASLTAWIDQGAVWEGVVDAPRVGDHWAFQAAVLPPVPNVENTTWARNPIDVFILARMEGEGLPPSPEADPYTLIRRLSLDLTGLPPHTGRSRTIR